MFVIPFNIYPLLEGIVSGCSLPLSVYVKIPFSNFKLSVPVILSSVPSALALIILIPASLSKVAPNFPYSSLSALYPPVSSALNIKPLFTILFSPADVSISNPSTTPFPSSPFTSILFDYLRDFLQEFIIQFV